MDATAIPALWRLAAWTVLAFGLWVAFGRLFAWLDVPLPQLGAAVLAWVGAGLMLPVMVAWLLRPALHWGQHWLEGTELLLGIR